MEKPEIYILTGGCKAEKITVTYNPTTHRFLWWGCGMKCAYSEKCPWAKGSRWHNYQPLDTRWFEKLPIAKRRAALVASLKREAEGLDQSKSNSERISRIRDILSQLSDQHENK